MPEKGDFEEDSDEDFELYSQDPLDDSGDNGNNNESSDEAEAEQEVTLNHPPPAVIDRPRRERQPPAWIRGGEYETE